MKKLTTLEMNRLTPEQYSQADKIPLVVVLDNVRSQHNVGAVFRTADAFRLQEIVLCGITCTPPNTEIHKTALGAELTVNWSWCKETLDAVRRLKEEGYQVFAVEQVHGSIPLQDVRTEHGEKYAIILGHEVFGVQQSVVDAADGCIEIPQYGTKHSLNVSVTAGILIYALSSQLINLKV